MSYILEIERNAVMHSLAYQVVMAAANYMTAYERDAAFTDVRREALFTALNVFASEWGKREL